MGIILGLEVSRLARNNADWYRLLDLCAMTDTLIGDADGLYHPSHFNDRLLLGLKGTMSEAELHVLRARLDGGIRNKAARGELRRGLPVGLVWGDADGEVLLHPDEAVTAAVRAVFERFTEFGSARRVWLWFRSEGLTFPNQSHGRAPLRWVAPTYTAIHNVLTNPVYAGAYTYGKTRRERFVDAQGNIQQRMFPVSGAEQLKTSGPKPGTRPMDRRDRVCELAGAPHRSRGCRLVEAVRGPARANLRAVDRPRAPADSEGRAVQAPERSAASGRHAAATARTGERARYVRRRRPRPPRIAVLIRSRRARRR